MKTKALFSLGLLLGLVLVARCSLVRQRAARYPSPDLEQIYGTSRGNLELNPVILVPGFAGSSLRRTEDGMIVWGAFLRCRRG